MNLFLKVIGVVLVLAGSVLTYKPTIVSKIPLPENSYQMIEMRVKWGFLIGLGIMLILLNQWNNWKLMAYAVLFFLTLGIVIARLVGVVLDTLYFKQLIWLAIEVVALVIFGILNQYADN